MLVCPLFNLFGKANHSAPGGSATRRWTAALMSRTKAKWTTVIITICKENEYGNSEDQGRRTGEAAAGDDSAAQLPFGFHPDPGHDAARAARLRAEGAGQDQAAAGGRVAGAEGQGQGSAKL